MKIRKWIAAGVLSSILMVPTTIFAEEGSGTGGANPNQSVNSVGSETSAKSLLMSETVSGDLVPITSPTSEYISNTTKIDFSNLASFQSYNSISDGKQTLSFNTPMEKLGFGSGWYSDWAPNVESRTPDILFSNFQNEVSIALSQPARTFGFELSSNLFGTYNFTVDYFSGTTLLGSLNQTITASFYTGDIKVFGATSNGAPFDKVVVRSNSGDVLGLAFAQFRYGDIDNQAPVTNAIMALKNNKFNVTLTATDDVSGVNKTEYRINNGNWMTYEAPVLLTTSQKLQFRSVDNAGNTEEMHTIGKVGGGFQLENVYVNSKDGLNGPYNQTLATPAEILAFFLNTSK